MAAAAAGGGGGRGVVVGVELVVARPPGLIDMIIDQAFKTGHRLARVVSFK